MKGVLTLFEKLKRRIYHKLGRNYDVERIRAGGGKIGEKVYLEGAFIDPGFLFLIEIGNHVTITHATILAHDGSTQFSLKKTTVGKVKIGDYVFIGYQAIVLPNVHIGNNVIIGAGSVVTDDIPDNSIAVGNPCKVVGKYSDFVSKNKKAMETHPVYDTYHADKSLEEIHRMQLELDTTWGYDE